MNRERSIRLSQVISSFGVGSIYDILGESLVLADIKRWQDEGFEGKGKKIEAERLIENLRSSGFPNVIELSEPAKKEGFRQQSGSLPFIRFPKWLFCSSCRKMKYWSSAEERPGEPPKCTCDRNPKLTPMRFVMICESGHMHDVDWVKWAHSKATDQQKTCRVNDLIFTSNNSKDGGLGSIEVKCRTCQASRSLEGITAPDRMRQVGVRCSGRQPWQAQEYDNGTCSARLHVVQRGAGNVYFPEVRSAITIPPESQYSYESTREQDLERVVKAHPLYTFLGNGNDDFREVLIAKMASALNRTVEEIRAALNTLSGHREVKPAGDIGDEEWQALTAELRETDHRDKFVTRHIAYGPENSTPEFLNCIDKVVSVVRLREVRVMTGFYRYQPAMKDEDGVAKPAIRPDLDGSLTWLPAMEVFGEGVFITLNENALQQWEKQQPVLDRIAVLSRRSKESISGNILPELTPRFVLLHTLAHILIRRLAFDSGYSSASLRERIYSKVPGRSGGPQAGILIYTAAGDAEGTLGGLARQAESGRFTSMLLAALQDAANCSADPICMESKGQGVDALNLAACHACSLVSETSCTSFNLGLDRALVTGGNNVTGFFQELLFSALESSLNQKGYETSIVQ